MKDKLLSFFKNSTNNNLKKELWIDRMVTKTLKVSLIFKFFFSIFYLISINLALYGLYPKISSLSTNNFQRESYFPNISDSIINGFNTKGIPFVFGKKVLVPFATTPRFPLSVVNRK